MKEYVLAFSLVLILLSGCVEEQVKESTTTTSVVETTTVTTTVAETTTTTEVTTTIEPETTTTTTVSKVSFSCSDYCKKEKFVDGICRKTPSECRKYSSTEIYTPLGDKYCPRGTGYNTCCCVFIKETAITTAIQTTTTTIEKKNSATLFEKIKPIDTTIKYNVNGSLTFKLLNVAGVDVKILNISSEDCSGLGIGNLASLEINNGADSLVTANCDEKEKDESFDVNVKISYSELVSDVAAIQSEETGKFSGFVEE